MRQSLPDKTPPLTQQGLNGPDDCSYNTMIPSRPEESGTASEYPIRSENRIETLVNGDAIFTSMLAAIANAKAEILLETYIYWNGVIGERFAKALAEASQRGVSSRVVLDAYGCMKLKEELVDIMKRGGVEIQRHRPVHWTRLKKSNHRSHRKLMIVDGLVGFIGGVGIADEWAGNARNPSEWRDNHYRVEGPVVQDMHRLFFTHWEGTQATHPAYQPDARSSHPADTVTCQLIASDPLHGNMHLAEACKRLLRDAEDTLRIVTPYFVPGDHFLELLLETAIRGVSTEIICAGSHNDRRIVRKASRYDWGTLLKAGVRIFEYNKTLIHEKLILVDQSTLLIGSANFDVRSLRLNEEASLLIKDGNLATEHLRDFAEDRMESREVDFETWNARPWTTRLFDAASHLFRSFL